MIRLVTGGRQSGKSTELVKIAAREFAYIVCADRNRVQYLQKLARAEGLDIPFPVTFSEFLQGHFRARGCRAFVIDDAGQLLRELACGVPVIAVAWETE